MTHTGAPGREKVRGRGPCWPSIDYGYLKDNSPTDERQQGGSASSDDQHGSAGSRRGGTCILFGTEARSDSSLAMVVPGKGNAAEWISRRIAGWIDRLGSKKCTLKMDNEPVIIALGIEIARKRLPDSETMMEHPEARESQSNAHAEGGVGVLKGIIFTFIDALRNKLGEVRSPVAALACRACSKHPEPSLRRQ